MHGDGGKGSGRRPMAVSDQQYKQRWDLIFGKDQDDTVLAGDKNNQESEQRVHDMETSEGKPDVGR